MARASSSNHRSIYRGGAGTSLHRERSFFRPIGSGPDASARWYSEKFGLQVVMQAPKTKTVKSAVILLAGGGLLVELIQNDDAMPLSKALPTLKDPTQIHGIMKSGLVVNNFDKTLEVLRARNVTILMGPFPARDPTGLRNFIIEDNARNLIQFFGK